MERRVEAPDYAAPLLGWRTWTLSRKGDRVRLRSVVKPTIWEPGRPCGAECLRPRLLRRFRRHSAPSFGCDCGIYAAELDIAALYLSDLRLGRPGEVRQVLGRVALWGEVVECERGYRASLAYPIELYVAARAAGGMLRDGAAEVAAALEDYGVPVAVVDADEPSLPALLAAAA
ncbi:MAG TPA: hypothetical protein VFL66_02080 [Gaiellaceae bacterium]|nr:hypothetical protein [Gaiellaceae bacterium]